MREDPRRLCFEITARDGAARTGLLHTPHGPIRTPAFVPLATTATVKSLDAPEVAELGFDMVLGNTFHLDLRPGRERIERFGGLHAFMGWDRPIITDSGGFQVFSLAHGSVADEIKGRGGQRRSEGAILEIAEEGVRFRSYLDGDERFIGPETSMEIQAALGSDIALAFDECTPFHADRGYTARSMQRTHRWLTRCADWHREHGPAGQALYGIVQGGIHPDLRAEAAGVVGDAEIDGIAIGGTLGDSKEQMLAVLDDTLGHLPAAAPRHLLGIGEIDDLLAGSARGIDTFDCAVPTRLARHGMAMGPFPESRYRVDLAKGRYADDADPPVPGCPCPACRHTRGYLHYLHKAGEMTAVRLLTLHNLHFVQYLMAGVRAAIIAGTLAAYAEAIARGAAPWDEADAP
ncbi:MAG: tRNA guanosine(34) transglycosylase Tgt [Solirubrobacterales bacterium]